MSTDILRDPLNSFGTHSQPESSRKDTRILPGPLDGHRGDNRHERRARRYRLLTH